MWQGFLMLYVGLLLTILMGKRDRGLFYLLLVAYALRSGLALTHAFVFPLPDSQADAITFERVAVTWAASGWTGWLVHFTSGPYFYSWLVAFFYLLLGHSPLMAQALNVIAGTLAVYNVYRAAGALWGYRYGLRAAWIMAIFPISLLYSAITMRESFMLMFFTWGLSGWAQAMKRAYWLPYMQALLGFFLSAMLHTAMIWGVVVTLTQLLLMALKKILKGRLPRTAVLIVAGGGMMVAIICHTGWGIDYIFGILRGTTPLLELIAYHAEEGARGRAAYLPGFIPHSWLDVIWMTPVRMIYFLFAPLYCVRAAKDFLGFGVALLWLILTYIVYRGLKRVWCVSAGVRWALVMLLLTWGTLSVGVSNYGTSIRHSLKLLPLCLVMVPYPRLLFWRMPARSERSV